jgi:hypothetical protein
MSMERFKTFCFNLNYLLERNHYLRITDSDTKRKDHLTSELKTVSSLITMLMPELKERRDFLHKANDTSKASSIPCQHPTANYQQTCLRLSTLSGTVSLLPVRIFNPSIQTYDPSSQTPHQFPRRKHDQINSLESNTSKHPNEHIINR